MADEVVVDWFKWSCFSKSTERIKAKNISLESFFKAQDSKIICLRLLELFRYVNSGANFCIFNFVSKNVVRV